MPKLYPVESTHLLVSPGNEDTYRFAVRIKGGDLYAYYREHTMEELQNTKESFEDLFMIDGKIDLSDWYFMGHLAEEDMYHVTH